MVLCERCEKSQATFHLTNIEPDGEKSERHLCDSCADEEGFIPHAKSAVDISMYLETFLTAPKAGAAKDLICEECGISYHEFRKSGSLGCPHDYDAFKDPLSKLLRRVHDGGTTHIGKTTGVAQSPKKDAAREIRTLRKQLDEAVKAEDYERAAALRDRISDMETA
ncbi:MAG: UvrB/UvrC motif-containing protein [Phycisphaerae bacterium]